MFEYCTRKKYKEILFTRLSGACVYRQTKLCIRWYVIYYM